LSGLRLRSSRRSWVRRLPGTKLGGWVGSGRSERRGSQGICQMVWNSSGRVAGIGHTFLLTRLYLRTRVVGSAGGSGGKVGDVVGSSGVESAYEAVRLQTEMTLTEGARPAQGQVGTYILRAVLAGSRTETSTSPLGRSSKRQRAVCWKGRPSRSPKEAHSMTCVWTLRYTSLTCSVRFSAHPTVQLVAPLAPSILISQWWLSRMPRAWTMSSQMMLI
jgi:hypothetical protein